MFIYPYKMASQSARNLSEAIGAMRIKTEGSRFKGHPDKVVINWGSSELPEEVMKCKVINPPEVTNAATNKLKFFEKMTTNNSDAIRYEDIVRIPDYTKDPRVAAIWSADGHTVVVRHKLTGNSGEGIELVEPNEEMPEAPLYVKYIPKKQEYRVHVANGGVVDLQRKARRRDVPDDQINWKIRNHDNGFIFARNDLVVPHSVSQEALAACRAINLDFGAVDIIYNERQQQAYVLEINTAPGLEGETLEGYAERFKNWGEPKVQADEAHD